MKPLWINGANIYVSDTGGSGAPILFIHGLMLASDSWHKQVAHFSKTHRVITFDLRGQGLSDKTTDRLDLDSLAEDAGAIIESLAAGPVHVVGFSMGSFIAMRLAARRPELVQTLTLIGPSADAEEPENLPRYQVLIALVRLFGPRAFTRLLMKILFGQTYLADPTVRAERNHWRGVLRGLPRALHRAAAASAGRKAIWDLLPRITVPTLIISGSEDRPISPERARRVHHGIVGSRWVPVPNTGHAVMIERPVTFNTLLETFLLETTP